MKHKEEQENVEDINHVNHINQINPVNQLLDIPSKYAILMLLNKNDGRILTLTQFSEKLKISKAAIRQAINRPSRQDGLEIEGLVKKVNKGYKITEKGMKELEIYIENKEKPNQIEEIEKNYDQFLPSIEKYIELYLDVHLEEARKHNAIQIDYKKLSKIDPDLAFEMSDNPDDILDLIREVWREREGPLSHTNVVNLTKDRQVKIGELRSNHIGRLIELEGSIVDLSSVKSKITNAIFECPNCDNQFSILQRGSRLVKPIACRCGKKKNFRHLKNDLVDFQSITLEELSEDLGDRDTARKIELLLKGLFLTSINFQGYYEDSYNPIRVIGILRENPIYIGNVTSTELRWVFEVLSVSFKKRKDLKRLSDSDKSQILKLQKGDKKALIAKLVESFAPHIKGYESEKTAILCAIVSGGDVECFGGDKRDDLHVLLVGDPGIAKTQLGKSVGEFFPLFRKVNCDSTTGVGLISAATKDQTTGNWKISKGVFPMSNGGIVFLDELDKLKRIEPLYPVLEDQEVSVDKASIHVRFKTDVTCLAAMNPKSNDSEKFIQDDNKWAQVGLPVGLISRFDLVIAMYDFPDEKKDREIAEHILNRKKIEQDPPFSGEFMGKYLFFCRNLRPKLCRESMEYVKEQYVDLKKSVVNITPRAIHSIYRLSVCIAKLSGDEVVNKSHAEVAIVLYRLFLQKLDLLSIDKLG